ncbi:MAG: hypothetical protein ACYDDA_00215 [Acidiferrobacteraceae bacterium]
MTARELYRLIAREEPSAETALRLLALAQALHAEEDDPILILVAYHEYLTGVLGRMPKELAHTAQTTVEHTAQTLQEMAKTEAAAAVAEVDGTLRYRTLETVQQLGHEALRLRTQARATAQWLGALLLSAGGALLGIIYAGAATLDTRLPTWLVIARRLLTAPTGLILAPVAGVAYFQWLREDADGWMGPFLGGAFLGGMVALVTVMIK